MTATAPRTREQMADRVAGCIEAGDLRQALQASQDLNRHHPDYAYGWYLASWLLRKTQRLPDALRTIDRALLLEPSDRFRLHRARCLLEAGDMAGAAAAAGELRGRTLADAVLHGETRHTAVPGGRSCGRAGALLRGHRARPAQPGVPLQPGCGAPLPRRRRRRRAGLRRGDRAAPRRVRGVQRPCAAQDSRRPLTITSHNCAT